MNILITGSNGRIGNILINYLKKNWIRGLDSNNNNINPLLNEFILCDLLDDKLINQSLEGIDIVIHLAALMSWHPNDEQLLFKSNVLGTYNLIQKIRNFKISKFIFSSSGEVYPETNPQFLPITEDHPTLPTSTYGMTKLLGEVMIKNIFEQIKLPYTILRFGHSQTSQELYNSDSFFSGPRFYLNSKIKQLEKFPVSESITNSLYNLKSVATDNEQHYISMDANGHFYRMNITDVRDICNAIELAIYNHNSEFQTFNICSKNSFQFDDAVNYLSKYTSLPVVKVKLLTKPQNYETSIKKSQIYLNFEPKYDIYKMIEEGAKEQKK